MGKPQLDLFAVEQPAAPERCPIFVAETRARLHATLALVKAAEKMPWDDMLRIIREDNGFRWAKDVLPAEEGAALWAEFDREMDRLYAIMNAGLEPEPLD